MSHQVVITFDIDENKVQENAEKEAAKLEAEGEAEYMKLIREAYDTEEKEEFYSFLRGLDALEQSFTSGNSTIILNRDSELVKLLYGAGLTEQN